MNAPRSRRRDIPHPLANNGSRYFLRQRLNSRRKINILTRSKTGGFNADQRSAYSMSQKRHGPYTYICALKNGWMLHSSIGGIYNSAGVARLVGQYRAIASYEAVAGVEMMGMGL